MLDPKEVFKVDTECVVGQKASFTKTIEASDAYLFAGISGDFNPAHLDSESAKNSMFKARVAHGMVTAGLISGAITMKLPGMGSVVKSQSVSFKKPVFFGDTVTVNLEVLEINGNLVKMSADSTNQNGDVVVASTVVVELPKKI